MNNFVTRLFGGGGGTARGLCLTCDFQDPCWVLEIGQCVSAVLMVVSGEVGKVLITPLCNNPNVGLNIGSQPRTGLSETSS